MVIVTKPQKRGGQGRTWTVVPYDDDGDDDDDDDDDE
jgi:hypothetical protein